MLIAFYYLLRFPWRRNVEGAACGVLVGGVASLPFTLNGYPPSVVLDPLLSALWSHAGSATENVFRVLSYDGSNLWTMVVWPANGVSSASRYYFPDYRPLLANLSYQEAGRSLFLLTLGAAAAWMLLRRDELRRRPDLIFVVVAFIFLAQLFLNTRSVARYFVFPLALTVPALSGPRWQAAAAAFVALSFTAFAGNYGSLAAVLDRFPEHAPALDPDGNPLSASLLYLFRSDVFMTAASALNLFALLSLALALRRTPLSAARVLHRFERMLSPLRAVPRQRSLPRAFQWKEGAVEREH